MCICKFISAYVLTYKSILIHACVTMYLYISIYIDLHTCIYEITYIGLCKNI